jgi:hypothetical protein
MSVADAGSIVLTLVDHAEDVSDEVNPAPSPGRAEEDGADRGDQAAVAVGDHHLNVLQATGS